MMKALRKWSELVGKTVEKAEELDDDVVLVFTNDTYALIRSGPSYDGDRTAADLEEAKQPHRWTNENMAHQLAQLGIWDNDDYLKWQELSKAATEESRAATERRERAQLAQLKAKYESGQRT